MPGYLFLHHIVKQQLREAPPPTHTHKMMSSVMASSVVPKLCTMAVESATANTEAPWDVSLGITGLGQYPKNTVPTYLLPASVTAWLHLQEMAGNLPLPPLATRCCHFNMWIAFSRSGHSLVNFKARKPSREGARMVGVTVKTVCVNVRL